MTADTTSNPFTGCLPPDPDLKNDDRAEWAFAALAAFRDATGTDEEDALGDLLTDLRHWADRNNYDFDAAMDRANHHYQAETTPDPAHQTLTGHFIGQITVIIDASDSSAAEYRLRKIASHIEDTSSDVIFADHNGDVEDYEAAQAECTESLCGKFATAGSTTSNITPTELLETLCNCIRILADYDEQDGDEGDTYRRCLALMERLSKKPFQITTSTNSQGD